jgi:hypothetical protein
MSTFNGYVWSGRLLARVGLSRPDGLVVREALASIDQHREETVVTTAALVMLGARAVGPLEDRRYAVRIAIPVGDDKHRAVELLVRAYDDSAFQRTDVFLGKDALCAFVLAVDYGRQEFTLSMPEPTDPAPAK